MHEPTEASVIWNSFNEKKIDEYIENGLKDKKAEKNFKRKPYQTERRQAKNGK